MADNVVYAHTAQAEMLKIIKRLDKEEARERWLAAKQNNEAEASLNRADALATKRRQYEFALSVLNGEQPAATGAQDAGSLAAV